jgi:microsomal dipeptidase-like Zn-dependent dipeptidase
LSEIGKRLVEACNAKGILIDLAHSPGASIDQALAIRSQPMVFSHGWVDQDEGRWQERLRLPEAPSLPAHARKIAARGGVIGPLGSGPQANPPAERAPGKGTWTVGHRDTTAYARELAHLVGWVGADHVAIAATSRASAAASRSTTTPRCAR